MTGIDFANKESSTVVQVVTTSQYVVAEFDIRDVPPERIWAAEQWIAKQLCLAMREEEERLFYPMGTGPVVEIQPERKQIKGITPEAA